MSYSLAHVTVNDKPNPPKSFNNGLPKHAAIAVALRPALATAVSATQSPTLLPNAITVNPNNAVLTFHINPNVCNNATHSVAINFNQHILPAKANNEKPG